MTAGGFFEQFIEDYYAECEEHLATIRRVLLALDEHPGTATTDAPQLHELFRALHTVKGLSGMVGLGAAERIAHAMEEALRARGAADAPVDAPLVEALFAGARALERCIAARRAGHEPPDVEALLAELGGVPARAPSHEPERPAAAPPALHAPPAGAGERSAPEHGGALTAGSAPRASVVYRFEFTPSPELARKGIGVATARARLQAAGDLLEATPRVVDGGGVVFDFRVALHADEPPPESWRAEGLTWTVDAGATHDGAAPEPGARRPSPAAPADPVALAATGSNVVRVELTRLDELMRLVGELVVSRARLVDALRDADGSGGGRARDSLHETSAAMERQLRTLREAVTRMRLVPVGEVFERMRFAVREVAREAGRRVALELAGQSTEIDKLVVDRMLEPLLHLVRNAVSHGIEPPEERVARGKPPEGHIALRAAAAGDRITIEVEDDGAGIDPERLAARAEALGLSAPDARRGSDAMLDVLCAPGFSTRDEADLASGRGVGMGVVRSAIQELGGQLAIESESGRGTRFTIELPLTLMIVDALLVEVGAQRMAVPQPVLREILQVEGATLTRFENNQVIAHQGGVLPLVDLRRLFGMPASSRRVLHLLVVGSDSQRAGLIVDRVLGLREIVVHPVPDPLVAVPGIAGATELGDGRVSLILDAASLVRLAGERRAMGARPGTPTTAGATLTA